MVNGVTGGPIGIADAIYYLRKSADQTGEEPEQSDLPNVMSALGVLTGQAMQSESQGGENMSSVSRNYSSGQPIIPKTGPQSTKVSETAKQRLQLGTDVVVDQTGLFDKYIKNLVLNRGSHFLHIPSEGVYNTFSYGGRMFLYKENSSDKYYPTSPYIPFNGWVYSPFTWDITWELKYNEFDPVQITSGNNLVSGAFLANHPDFFDDASSEQENFEIQRRQDWFFMPIEDDYTFDIMQAYKVYSSSGYNYNPNLITDEVEYKNEFIEQLALQGLDFVPFRTIPEQSDIEYRADNYNMTYIEAFVELYNEINGTSFPDIEALNVEAKYDFYKKVDSLGFSKLVFCKETDNDRGLKLLEHIVKTENAEGYRFRYGQLVREHNVALATLASEHTVFSAYPDKGQVYLTFAIDPDSYTDYEILYTDNPGENADWHTLNYVPVDSPYGEQKMIDNTLGDNSFRVYKVNFTMLSGSDAESDPDYSVMEEELQSLLNGKSVPSGNTVDIDLVYGYWINGDNIKDAYLKAFIDANQGVYNYQGNPLFSDTDGIYTENSAELSYDLIFDNIMYVAENSTSISSNLSAKGIVDYDPYDLSSEYNSIVYEFINQSNVDLSGLSTNVLFVYIANKADLTGKDFSEVFSDVYNKYISTTEWDSLLAALNITGYKDFITSDTSYDVTNMEFAEYLVSNLSNPLSEPTDFESLLVYKDNQAAILALSNTKEDDPKQIFLDDLNSFIKENNFEAKFIDSEKAYDLYMEGKSVKSSFLISLIETLGNFNLTETTKNKINNNDILFEVLISLTPVTFDNINLIVNLATANLNSDQKISLSLYSEIDSDKYYISGVPVTKSFYQTLLNGFYSPSQIRTNIRIYVNQKYKELLNEYKVEHLDAIYIKDPSQSNRITSESQAVWMNNVTKIANLENQVALARSYQREFDSLLSGIDNMISLSSAGQFPAWAVKDQNGTLVLDSSKNGAQNSASDADIDLIRSLIAAQKLVDTNKWSSIGVDYKQRALSLIEHAQKKLFRLENGVLVLKPSEDWDNGYIFTDYMNPAACVEISAFLSQNGATQSDIDFWVKAARDMMNTYKVIYRDCGEFCSKAIINVDTQGNISASNYSGTTQTYDGIRSPMRIGEYILEHSESSDDFDFVKAYVNDGLNTQWTYDEIMDKALYLPSVIALGDGESASQMVQDIVDSENQLNIDKYYGNSFIMNSLLSVLESYSVDFEPSNYLNAYERSMYKGLQSASVVNELAVYGINIPDYGSPEYTAIGEELLSLFNGKSKPIGKSVDGNAIFGYWKQGYSLKESYVKAFFEANMGDGLLDGYYYKGVPLWIDRNGDGQFNDVLNEAHNDLSNDELFDVLQRISKDGAAYDTALNKIGITGFYAKELDVNRYVFAKYLIDNLEEGSFNDLNFDYLEPFFKTPQLFVELFKSIPIDKTLKYKIINYEATMSDPDMKVALSDLVNFFDATDYQAEGELDFNIYYKLIQDGKRVDLSSCLSYLSTNKIDLRFNREIIRYDKPVDAMSIEEVKENLNRIKIDTSTWYSDYYSLGKDLLKLLEGRYLCVDGSVPITWINGAKSQGSKIAFVDKFIDKNGAIFSGGESFTANTAWNDEKAEKAFEIIAKQLDYTYFNNPQVTWKTINNDESNLKELTLLDKGIENIPYDNETDLYRELVDQMIGSDTSQYGITDMQKLFLIWSEYSKTLKESNSRYCTYLFKKGNAEISYYRAVLLSRGYKNINFLDSYGYSEEQMVFINKLVNSNNDLHNLTEEIDDLVSLYQSDYHSGMSIISNPENSSLKKFFSISSVNPERQRENITKYYDDYNEWGTSTFLPTDYKYIKGFEINGYCLSSFPAISNFYSIILLEYESSVNLQEQVQLKLDYVDIFGSKNKLDITKRTPGKVHGWLHYENIPYTVFDVKAKEDSEYNSISKYIIYKYNGKIWLENNTGLITESGTEEFNQEMAKLSKNYYEIYEKTLKPEIKTYADALLARDYSFLFSSNNNINVSVFPEKHTDGSKNISSPVKTIFSNNPEIVIPLSDERSQAFIAAKINSIFNGNLSLAEAQEKFLQIQQMYSAAIPAKEIGGLGQLSFLMLEKLNEYIDKGFINKVDELIELPMNMGILDSSTGVKFNQDGTITVKATIGNKTNDYKLKVNDLGEVTEIASTVEIKDNPNASYINNGEGLEKIELTNDDHKYIMARVYQALVGSGDPLMQEMFTLGSTESGIPTMKLSSNVKEKLGNSGQMYKVDSETFFFFSLVPVVDDSITNDPVTGEPSVPGEASTQFQFVMIEDSKGCPPLAQRITLDSSKKEIIKFEAVNNFFEEDKDDRDWKNLSKELAGATNASLDENDMAVVQSGWDIVGGIMLALFGGWLINMLIAAASQALAAAASQMAFVQQAMDSVNWAKGIYDTVNGFIDVYEKGQSVVDAINGKPQNLFNSFVPQEIKDVQATVENGAMSIVQSILPAEVNGVIKTVDDLKDMYENNDIVLAIKQGEEMIKLAHDEVEKIVNVVNGEVIVEYKVAADKLNNSLQEYLKNNNPEVAIVVPETNGQNTDSINVDGILPTIKLDCPLGVQLPSLLNGLNGKSFDVSGYKVIGEPTITNTGNTFRIEDSTSVFSSTENGIPELEENGVSYTFEDYKDGKISFEDYESKVKEKLTHYYKKFSGIEGLGFSMLNENTNTGVRTSIKKEDEGKYVLALTNDSNYMEVEYNPITQKAKVVKAIPGYMNFDLGINSSSVDFNIQGIGELNEDLKTIRSYDRDMFEEMMYQMTLLRNAAVLNKGLENLFIMKTVKEELDGINANLNVDFSFRGMNIDLINSSLELNRPKLKGHESRSKVQDMAYLADWIYYDKEDDGSDEYHFDNYVNRLGDNWIVERSIDTNNYLKCGFDSKNISGYQAAAVTYKSDQNGPLYIVSRGTEGGLEGIRDWVLGNGLQPFGLDLQLSAAKQFYNEVRAQYGTRPIYFVGHSRGGGVSQAMSVWAREINFDSKAEGAITFNPAGTWLQVERWGLPVSSNYYRDYIDNYIVNNDITPFSLPQVGSVYLCNNIVNGNTHGLKNFFDSANSLQEINDVGIFDFRYKVATVLSKLLSNNFQSIDYNTNRIIEDYSENSMRIYIGVNF